MHVQAAESPHRSAYAARDVRLARDIAVNENGFDAFRL
jgi:hypothetical protein